MWAFLVSAAEAVSFRFSQYKLHMLNFERARSPGRIVIRSQVAFKFGSASVWPCLHTNALFFLDFSRY